MLNSEHQRQADENLHRLRSVVATVVFCGKQGIALRGHRNESAASRASQTANPGNFAALMNFRAAAGDKYACGTFHQARGGKHVTYCGSRIQNDIIECCRDEVRFSLVQEVNSSPFFSVLADEAADCSNKEQMPLVVRFVKDAVIREEFMGFALCDSGTSGRALADVILKSLREWGIEMDHMRGQGYDGAGNMAGRLSGCAAIISESYPKALYVHCASHCLNLCIVTASKLTPVTNMWSILLDVSMFFKYSPKRQSKLEDVISAAAGNERAWVTKLVDLFN